MLNKIKELELKIKNHREKYNEFTMEVKKLEDKIKYGDLELYMIIKEVYNNKYIILTDERKSLKDELEEITDKIESDYCKYNFNVDIDGGLACVILNKEQYSIYSNSKEFRMIEELLGRNEDILYESIKYTDEIDKYIRETLELMCRQGIKIKN